MGKTDDLVRVRMNQLTDKLCDAYETFLPDGGDDVFFDELCKMDAGLTKRLARRPLQRMEIPMVTKKAGAKFKEMCARCKAR